MPTSRPPYPPEFRRQILELVRAGRSPDELAKEYEPTAQTIRNWMAQDDRDAGRRTDGLTSEERAELTKLRRALGGRRLVKAAPSAAKPGRAVASKAAPNT